MDKPIYYSNGWARIYAWVHPQLLGHLSRNAMEWDTAIDNLAMCLKTAGIEYARYRAYMRSLMGWSLAPVEDTHALVAALTYQRAHWQKFCNMWTMLFKG